MSFDSIGSALWFFSCVAMLYIVFAPIGTLTEAFIRYISSGKLLIPLLAVNELVLFLLFTACIHYLDTLLPAVDLSTFAECNLSIIVFAGSYLIQKAGDWVKKKDETRKS
ncbi:hypothetical protein [Brevibacillus borstelensis]|uniref:hypothetical protein n=1 Tax=Brevibacillus borstelensis TaxID=45462 RepID=UPI0030BB1D90